MVQLTSKSLALLAVALVSDPVRSRIIQASNIKLHDAAAGTNAQIKQAFQSGPYLLSSFRNI